MSFQNIIPPGLFCLLIFPTHSFPQQVLVHSPDPLGDAPPAASTDQGLGLQGRGGSCPTQALGFSGHTLEAEPSYDVELTDDNTQWNRTLVKELTNLQLNWALLPGRNHSPGHSLPPPSADILTSPRTGSPAWGNRAQHRPETRCQQRSWAGQEGGVMSRPGPPAV